MIAADILLDGFFAAVAAVGFGAVSDPPMRAFPRIALLAAVWFGALDTPLYYLNNMVWDLLGKGTGYIDKIAYSIYYAGLGTVV